MVAVGIDIGNVYSRVAVANGEGGRLRAEILENDEGTRSMRTCIAFAEVPLFGELAVHHADERNVFYDLKRLMCSPDTADQHHPRFYKLATLDEGRVQVKFQWNSETTCLSPQQLFSMMIHKMKDVVEKQFDAAINEGIKAVISVPDAFSDRQRQAVTDAARIAGITHVNLVNDTTAAAVAYAVRKSSSTCQNLLVCDFGGSSSSVAIVKVRGLDVVVHSAESDCHLGGVDFDRLLASHFADGTHLSPNASRLLLGACEKAKKTLSSRLSTRIAVDVDGFTVNSNLTRESFEEICREHVDRIEHLLDTCLCRSKLCASDIDQIVAVGGSSRIPRIREILSTAFPDKHFNQTVNADEAIVTGAALLAASTSFPGAPKISVTYALRGIEGIFESHAVQHEQDRSLNHGRDVYSPLTKAQLHQSREQIDKFKAAEIERNKLAHARNEVDAFFIAKAKSFEEDKQLPSGLKAKLTDHLAAARNGLKRVSKLEEVAIYKKDVSDLMELMLKEETKPSGLMKYVGAFRERVPGLRDFYQFGACCMASADESTRSDPTDDCYSVHEPTTPTVRPPGRQWNFTD